MSTTNETPPANPIVAWRDAVNAALKTDAPRVTQALLVQASGIPQSYVSGYWRAPDPWKARPISEEKRRQLHAGAVKVERQLARRGLIQDNATLPGGISAAAVEAYNAAVYAARRDAGRSTRGSRAA